jgi:hypothetical protein
MRRQSLSLARLDTHRPLETKEVGMWWERDPAYRRWFQSGRPVEKKGPDGGPGIW